MHHMCRYRIPIRVGHQTH